MVLCFRCAQARRVPEVGDITLSTAVKTILDHKKSGAQTVPDILDVIPSHGRNGGGCSDETRAASRVILGNNLHTYKLLHFSPEQPIHALPESQPQNVKTMGALPATQHWASVQTSSLQTVVQA